MAFKQFTLDNNTTVTIYKRKTSRSLRLSISPNGKVRVSIPSWTTYERGLSFAKSRQLWIKAQQQPARTLLNGSPVGKAHHLNFVPDPFSKKPTSRVRASEIVVTYPASLQSSSLSVQEVAEAASIRALRAQAQKLLPQRLATLARINNFEYTSVAVKRLKSRWGSCDHRRNIVLNLFLMQLPWENIDYVLIHELVHTKVLHHGTDFWQEMERVLPNAKRYRKDMKNYQPILHG
jgi:predicted metal-dependent hydrolase